MALSQERWNEITPSPHAHEREALLFVRELLPDHEPYRAWSNFEFRALDGSVNEVDLLVLSKKGAFLIEIKSWPGEIRGDWGGWVWTRDGRSSSVDNPHPLLERKCKRLKALLTPHFQKTKARVPFFEGLVFLSADGVSVKLDPVARKGVFTRSDLRRVLVEISPDEYNEHRLLDKPQAKAVAQAMAKAGVRTKARRIGDFKLERMLVDGTGYQDWEASHTSLTDDPKRRVRLYGFELSAGEEQRAALRRAAQREYRALEGIEHSGILRARHFTESEIGPALVFDHDPTAQRLDQYVQDRQDRLTDDHRLSFLRQIGEAIRYAHDRGLVHRALSPQSVLVQKPDSLQPRLVVYNWQTGARAATSSTDGAPGVSATAHVDRWIDRAAECYLAPELRTGQGESREQLDVFSLGALAWFLFTGKPPASDATELVRKLHQTQGLRIDAEIDGTPSELVDLVAFATHPDRVTRIGTAAEFLDWLEPVEEAFTRPDTAAVKNPSDARPGEYLEGGYRVEKRLGKGSSAVAYTVKKDDAEYVLKVALDPEQNDRLRGEGEVLQKLRHSAIVVCKDIVDIGDRVALLLDRAGGSTLSDRLRQEGCLQAELLERLGIDLLDAVRYLESEGINHRDIKPDNLGIVKRGRNDELHLVLFDFSLARAPADAIHAGTRPYLDPFLELRRTKRFDLHAERFAAAMTLHQMTNGTLPKWGDGESSPAALTCEVTIDEERLPTDFRAPLAAFFRRALARETSGRFANAEEMLHAWRGVFHGAGEAPAAKESKRRGAVATADKPVDNEVDEAARGQALADATLHTPVAALGLSGRASGALDRLGVVTVEQLLLLPAGDLYHMSGVGRKTRDELLQSVRDLKRRFPDVFDKSSKPDSARRLVVEQVAATLLPKAAAGKGAAGRDASLRYLLGLDSLSGAACPQWPSQTEVAAALRTRPAAVNLALGNSRKAWGKQPLVTEVRDDVAEALKAHGGVMTPPELGEAMLATRGTLIPDHRAAAPYAIAVARAAVEAEGNLQEPRFLVRRTEGRVFIACDRDGFDGARLIDVAMRLGALADQIAAEDPLPSPGEVARRIADVPWPDETRRPAPLRLARLATAASKQACLSGRLEVYPRGLAVERALRLAHGALLGPKELTAADIETRLRARYPECGALPDLDDLKRILNDAGYPHRFREDAADGNGAFCLPLHTTVVSTAPTRSSRWTTDLDNPAQMSEEAAEATAFEKRLQRATREGAFLVLGVDVDKAEKASAELRDPRFAVDVMSVEALLLDAMRAKAAELEVDWSVALFADREDAPREDARNLRELVSMAIPAVEERLRCAERTVVLTEPGLLARYDQLDLLERLRDRVGMRPKAGDPGLFGLWVVVPCDGQTEAPRLDGRAVPVITRAQWARVPRAWVNNQHRGRPDEVRRKKSERARR